MFIQKSTLIVKLLVSIGLVLAALSAAQAQGQTSATLFRDRESLTIFIPKTEGGVSLANVWVQVPELAAGVGARRGIALAEIPGFAGIDFANVPTPICLRLIKDKSETPAPLACRESLIFIQALIAGDIFWIDNLGNALNIFVSRENEQPDIVVCPGSSSECPFQLPTTGGAAAVAPAEGIVNRGIELLRAEKYNEASASFTEYIQAVRNDPTPERPTDGYMLKALAAIFQGNFPEALEAYNQAVLLQEANYYARVGRGKLYLIEDNPQAALDDFSRAVALEPNKPEGYFLRARAYRELGQYELALQDFQTAEVNGMDTALILTEKGWTYLDQNQPEAALVAFNQALAIDPEQAAAYQGRSKANRMLGNDEQALADASRAIELETPTLIPSTLKTPVAGSTLEPATPVPLPALSPTEAISLFTRAINIDFQQDLSALFCDRGMAYLDAQELDPAVADFTQARAEDNEAACAYVGLALVYSLAGQPQETRTYADTALALAAQDDSVYNNVGVAFMNLGDNTGAIWNFAHAIELNSKVAVYYANRGTAYLNDDNHELAIADYNQVIALGGATADTYNNLGVAYMKSDKFTEAVSSFTEAINQGMDSANVFYNNGLTYLKLADYTQAVANFDEAIARETDNPDFYASQGDAYFNLGDYAQAIASYTQAVALGTGDVDVFYNRGVAYLNLSDYPNAITYLGEAIAREANNPLYYSARGTAYLNLDDYAHAVADYDKAASLGLADTQLFYNQGAAYLGLPDYAKAIASFDQAIALEPVNPLYFKARADGYMKLENYAQAIQDYDQAIALGAAEAGIWNNRGVAHSNLQQHAAAADDFRQAVNVDPSVDFYHYNLANALLNVKSNNCEAVQPLRDYLQLAGANADSGAQDTLAQLEQICK